MGILIYTHQIDYTGSAVYIENYSRLLISTIQNYENIVSGSYYKYVDGLTSTNSIIQVKGAENDLKDLIIHNSSLFGNTQLYLSNGLFSGTYGIEINGMVLTGDNAKVLLNDSNKNLYKVDGSFSIKLVDYNIDYSELRIGNNSMIYSNATELTWESNEALSWYGLEYHAGSLCGYIIPFVSPQGIITINENESFSFSGNILIDSTKSGLNAASTELNASENQGIRKFNYSVLPEKDLIVTDVYGATVTAQSTIAGSDTITVNSNIAIINSIKIPASIELYMTDDYVSGYNLSNPGWGYYGYNTGYYDDVAIVDPPLNGGIQAKVSIGFENGQILTVIITDEGSGYADGEIPTVHIISPPNYKKGDELIWTGKEWAFIQYINYGESNILHLKDNLTFSVDDNAILLSPYEYHKQQYYHPELLNQFYYFIHGKAKAPSNENLSYVKFSNGVQSEWIKHSSRTDTFPLKNSFLQLDYSDMSQNLLYNTWKYNGSDYPPTDIEIFENDTLSVDSRTECSTVTQCAFSFIDTIISTQSQTVPIYTPVIFSYDNCKIPGKNSPIWTIFNEHTQKIEIMTTEENFMWNFSKSGNYTVSLKLKDSNGNNSFGKKNSFIVV